MTDATAMPSQNHHLTAPCSLRLRHALGLLLGIVPAISFAQHSNPTVPAGFPNVARTPGERIAGNIAPNQGRTAIIAYHNGVLFTVPEAPSSNPGSDLQVRTWDISTPANLADPVELAQWGVTPMPIEAHGYFKNGNWLSIGDNRDWDPMLEPWAFEANPGGGVLRTSNPDFVCAGVRGCLFAPWILPASFWTYSAPEGNARIALDDWNNTLAEWDHRSLTGVLGQPFLLGNLLIYASTQERSGVATYDVSDPSNPVLLDVLKDGSPGGYWPELWGGDGKLYIVFPYRTAGNGMRVVDATDPSDLRFLADVPLPGDEAMYAQFQDEYAFIGSHKVDMRTFQSVLQLDNDLPWSNSYGSGTRISTSQFALPLGNLVVTGGAAPDQGMAIWAHQAEPDTRGPYVGYHIPRAGQANWPTNRLPVSLLIHETLETPTIINGDTFIVRPLGGGFVAGQITFSFDDVLTFTPDAPWQANTTYEVVIPAGGIKDAAGNGIDGYQFTFSTGASVGGNHAPSIQSLTATPQPLSPGGSLTASANATDADSDPLEYRFDFGDGSPKTAWSASTSAMHSYAEAGHFHVTVQVRDDENAIASRARRITVANAPSDTTTQSAPLVCADASRRVFTINPDNDTLAAVDADTLAVQYEVPVCDDPRSITLAGDNLWIACHGDDGIDVRSAASGVLVEHLDTGYGSAPSDIAATPGGDNVYVSLHGPGVLRRYDASTRGATGSLTLGQTAGALAINGDGSLVYVARQISAENDAEIWEVNTAGGMSLQRTLRVRRFGGDENADGTGSGRGVANNLRSLAIARDGQSLWFAANKANTERGLSFSDDLDEDNTVRNVLVGVNLADGSLLRQVDIDNSDSASAVALSPFGDDLLVALQGNNEVAVFDALNVANAAGSGGMTTRLAAGLAPQGVCADATTGRSFVKNLMERSLSVLETADLFDAGDISVSGSTVPTVSSEVMPASVLAGKRIFYNASDPRMSAEGYLSCATCHLDGGHDGRTWDFTGRGEGLRNTTTLRGRAGMAQGNVHWSGNFDEIQDFEHDIRGPFGGAGFMDDADFALANSPLGPNKAGYSVDLDALADYVSSLGHDHLPRSPFRNPDGSLTSEAEAGRSVFQQQGCADCHGGTEFTDSEVGPGNLHNVGTLRSSSGQRLGGPLTGIDTPSLLGVWNTAPYFHDGSAPTLEDVFTVAGGPVLQAEDGAISGGASMTPDLVWLWTDDSMKSRAGVDFSVAGNAVEFAGIDGGSGDTGAVELRYSAGYQALQSFTITVSGIGYPVQLPNTGNNPGWQHNRWQRFRLENVAFAPGMNTLRIESTANVSTTIDEVQISRPADLAASEPHRRVGALDGADRDALLAYLRQLDGNSLSAPTGNSVFRNGFESP